MRVRREGSKRGDWRGWSRSWCRGRGLCKKECLERMGKEHTGKTGVDNFFFCFPFHASLDFFFFFFFDIPRFVLPSSRGVIPAEADALTETDTDYSTFDFGPPDGFCVGLTLQPTLSQWLGTTLRTRRSLKLPYHCKSLGSDVRPSVVLSSCLRIHP